MRTLDKKLDLSDKVSGLTSDKISGLTSTKAMPDLDMNRLRKLSCIALHKYLTSIGCGYKLSAVDITYHILGQHIITGTKPPIHILKGYHSMNRLA